MSDISENPTINTDIIMLRISVNSYTLFHVWETFGWRPSWISVTNQHLYNFGLPQWCRDYLNISWKHLSKVKCITYMSSGHFWKYGFTIVSLWISKFLLVESFNYHILKSNVKVYAFKNIEAMASTAGSGINGSTSLSVYQERRPLAICETTYVCLP